MEQPGAGGRSFLHFMQAVLINRVRLTTIQAAGNWLR